VLKCVAVCCSLLQCVAVCCIDASFAAVQGKTLQDTRKVCCGVLQCVVVCCSALQCVALSLPGIYASFAGIQGKTMQVWCSVLQ